MKGGTSQGRNWSAVEGETSLEWSRKTTTELYTLWTISILELKDRWGTILIGSSPNNVTTIMWILTADKRELLINQTYK